MIDIKTAINIAKDYAKELFVNAPASVEEFEREDYSGRPAWVITLGVPARADSVPRDPYPGAVSPLSRFMPPSLEYKRIFIAEDNGEVLAMKIREFALR